jgi:oligosaccharide repeat unit polymerase
MYIILGFIVYNSYDWNYKSSVWILLGCILFTAGYVCAVRSINIRDVIQNKPTKINVEFVNAKKYLFVSLFIAMAGFFLRLNSYGINLSSLFNLGSLATINNEIAVNRYTGELFATAVSQSLLIFVYLSPLIGGLLYNYAGTTKNKIICISSILPALLLLLINNEKAGLISVIILWFSSFMSGYLVKYGTFPRPKKKSYLLLFTIFVIVMFILISSMVLRIGEVTTTSIDAAVNKLYSSYALGQMPAFDKFFNSQSGFINQLSFGKYTFYSVFDFLKISNRVPGVYNDFFVYGSTNTNVYTYFRGLISDFGSFGALFMLYILGLMTGLSYRNIKLKSSGKLALPTFTITAVLSFLLYFIISIFSYVSMLFAFIFYYFFLKKVLVTTSVGLKSRNQKVNNEG